jgi:hypothetical protein
MKHMSVTSGTAAGALILSLAILSGCVTSPGTGGQDREKATTKIAGQINELLRQGNEVKILLLISPENVTYVPGAKQPAPGPEWFESTARQVEAGYAEKLLRSHPKAVIVDRSVLDKALKELELQSSGLVSADTMTRVGSFVGANYLVSLSFARHTTKKGYQDTYIRKLVELASSRVLALDQVKNEYRRDDKGKPVLVSQTLNGRTFMTDTDGNSYYE